MESEKRFKIEFEDISELANEVWEWCDYHNIEFLSVSTHEFHWKKKGIRHHVINEKGCR